jgi:PHD/YefM family antitoxin component YafN of YafNO toxin-antitoxin module
MIRANNVRALSDFQRNTKQHLRRLKTSGEPEVLTVNGKAALVIQSADAYQRTLDRIAEGVELEKLRIAIHQADKGQGHSVDEVFRDAERELKKRGLK